MVPDLFSVRRRAGKGAPKKRLFILCLIEFHIRLYPYERERCLIMLPRIPTVTTIPSARWPPLISADRATGFYTRFFFHFESPFFYRIMNYHSYHDLGHCVYWKLLAIQFFSLCTARHKVYGFLLIYFYSFGYMLIMFSM